MSRTQDSRRTSATDPAKESAGSSIVGDPAAAPVATESSRILSPKTARTLFTLSLASFAAWLFALAFMALGTANPVTLNRDQILHAQFVVTGRVLDRASGTVEVLREWKHNVGNPAERVTLTNLERTGVRNGAEYLIPISKRPDGRLLVTETRLPANRPLVYPSSEAASKEMAELLAELGATRAANP